MISLRLTRFNGCLKSIYKNPKHCFASSPVFVESTDNNPLLNEWQIAKPFESVPRPSKFQILTSYFPGGRFYKKSFNEVQKQMRQDYGDIYLVPGLFGKSDMLFTFNPEDFKKVFRTEGAYPIRRGLDIIEYYRKTLRPDVFKDAAGLVAEHGEGWSKFRTAVNPVLMNPKTFKLYTPKMNALADQFVARIRKIRDPKTLEMPDNFEEEINSLTMETVGVVALDTHLGLIGQAVLDEDVKRFMKNLDDFFVLIVKLEFRPSFWKLVATPNYKKFISAMNILTDFITQKVEEAKERLKMNEENTLNKSEFEKSLLERLIKTSPAVAKVMAMDTLLAGVDTTASALTSCLLNIATNPEKQQKLREEAFTNLPEKDTPLTAEKMNNLPYLRACIKECLRLNPVTGANFRTTGQDIVLSGYRIPKDVDVIMPNQDLLRDEKNYPRAKEFLPERWLRSENSIDENGCPLKTNAPFVFLPFGFGPRMCIGKRIVDLELEVNLLKLVRNFEIGFDYPTEGVFKEYIINVPDKPLNFKFVDLKR